MERRRVELPTSALRTLQQLFPNIDTSIKGHGICVNTITGYHFGGILFFNHVRVCEFCEAKENVSVNDFF